MSEEDVQLNEECKTICKEITFSSEEFSLKGILHLPLNTEHPPVVVGSHGLFSDSSSPKQIALAEACSAQGMAYFRFDHRGCGKSDGVFKDATTWDGRCTDLINAIEAVRGRDDTGRRVGLFGSSLGGAVSLAVAKRMKVDAVVTFAAPTSGKTIQEAVAKEEEPEGAQLISHPEHLKFDILRKMAGIHHILIVHGDSDKVVSPSEAHKIYQQVVMPKRLIMLKNGDHRMSIKENQEKFFRETVLWFRSALKESKYPA